MSKIPASQDLYVDMQNNQVHNSDELRCQANSSTSGMIPMDWPMVQFDISNNNIGENDIAILAVKASAIHSKGQPGQIVMVPLESNWNEKSSYADVVFLNLMPTWELVDNPDTSKMSVDIEDDTIFAFDVSKKLADAKSMGQRNISFALMPLTNNSYEVDFMSRETGMGPYLIVIPYPSGLGLKKIKVSPLELNINETIMPATAIMQINESLADDWGNKGYALIQQGKYDEAIQAFDKAIELDPNYAEAWNNKGIALGELGKYDESIEAFDIAIKLDPQNADAWYYKGYALELLNKTAEADAAYAKSDELGNTGPSGIWTDNEKPFIRTASSDHMVERTRIENEAARITPISYELYLRNLSKRANMINNSA